MQKHFFKIGFLLVKAIHLKHNINVNYKESIDMATDERRPVKKSSSSSQRPSASRGQEPRSRSEAPRRPQTDAPRRSMEDAPRRSSPEGARRSQERPSRPSREADERRNAPRRERDDRREARYEREARPSKASRPRREEKKKSSTGKIILFAIELIVLVAMVVILYTVLKTEKVGKVEIKEEDIVMNQEIKAKIETTSGGGDGDGATTEAYSGYRNVALFGVDSREKALTKNTRSDTIIIASINEKTGDVKLVSVYRDTYLNLGNDAYNKCNAAYAKGGPVQAINMLNMNLDMDITDFVTIGFDGLIDVIDALGGVEVNVLESEIVHLNNYQISMVGKSSDGETFTATEGTDYTAVKSAGRQTLNGLQATAYCRIRYVGNDFMRAERQRAVIQAIVDKAKKNPTKLASIAENIFSEVYTSLDLSEIIELLGDISKYQIVDEGGFPEESLRGGANVGSKGSCVIPVDLEKNVKWLHEFLFDEKDYEPSNAVRSYSVQIYKDVSPYM